MTRLFVALALVGAFSFGQGKGDARFTSLHGIATTCAVHTHRYVAMMAKLGVDELDPVATALAGNLKDLDALAGVRMGMRDRAALNQLVDVFKLLKAEVDALRAGDKKKYAAARKKAAAEIGRLR